GRHGGGPYRDPPASPSCESTARLARTPSLTHPDGVPLVPAQSFSAGTSVHTVHGSWASWLSFTFRTPPLSTKPGQLQPSMTCWCPRSSWPAKSDSKITSANRISGLSLIPDFHFPGVLLVW